MKSSISDSLYRKLEVVSNQVKKQFRNKGIVIPIKNDDGSISLGNYTIVKENNFYKILNYAQETVVENINLPQTAAVLANNLALGKFIDIQILNIDRKYGYAEFEEQLSTRLLKKSKNNLVLYDLSLANGREKQAKKEFYRQEIQRSFEKLRKFV
jgi:hypothetical protein